MNRKLITLSIVVAFFTFSCSSTNQNTNTNNFDAHSSQNSLDWQGTYFGVLPCASCPGIETELTLTNNQAFILTRKYIDKKEIFTSKGTFIWNDNSIKLIDSINKENPITFKVEEGRIRQLDVNGNIIEGALASSYLLTKSGNIEVEDKKWLIIELNGKPIPEKTVKPYLIFHSKKGFIEAKANCNSLSFKYSIRNQNQLIIQPGITTLMACPDNLEQELIKAISNSDKLSLSGTILSLNNAEQRMLIKCKLAE
ncbi:MAG: copper resistance protein NlpE N-terminal domain-containing protein [Sediminibacterium sp.]|jgi:uncharacterized lipoprotein NlpE involved in copper resistance